MAKNDSTQIYSNAEISSILLTFFKEHPKNGFNSKKIHETLKKDDRYGAMINTELETIRTVLNDLVSAKKITSHKSEKGNWLIYNKA